jgi:molecular chaperone HscB
VGRQEKALQAELARHLDESLDLEAAVGAVRSLMFLGRFRADIQRRMEALES